MRSNTTLSDIVTNDKSNLQRVNRQIHQSSTPQQNPVCTLQMPEGQHFTKSAFHLKYSCGIAALKNIL